MEKALSVPKAKQRLIAFNSNKAVVLTMGDGSEELRKRFNVHSGEALVLEVCAICMFVCPPAQVSVILVIQCAGA